MRLVFKFFISVVILYSVFANAENTSATEKLQQHLKNIKTLQADFSQESFDAKNIVLQKQSGHFKVRESGEFIWSIAAPYEQKIISDGKVLKIFDPDLEQVTIKPLDKKSQVVPLLLFSGESDSITQHYEITNPSADAFELLSKNKNNLFEKLQISFANEKPDTLSIVDSMNQKTLVHFSNVIINQSLKASVFQFNEPAGVDVIDERKIDER